MDRREKSRFKCEDKTLTPGEKLIVTGIEGALCLVMILTLWAVAKFLWF